MKHNQKSTLIAAGILLFCTAGQAQAVVQAAPPTYVPNAAPPPTAPSATFHPDVPTAVPPTTDPTAPFILVAPTPHPVLCGKGICPVPSFTIPPLPCDFFPSLACPRPADGIYIVLGDSLALGFYGTPGYASIFEDKLEFARNIELDSRQLGRAGWHSSHLAAALEYDPLFRQNVAEADVITWNIGGNDLRTARDLFHQGQCGGADNQECLRRAVTAFKNNWSVIIREIKTLRKTDSVLIRTMDLYNPFVKEDMARGTFVVLDWYFDEVNTYIASSLQQAGILFAHVSVAFNGPNGLEDPADKGFISFDGYHPNSAGHRVIADQLLRTGIPSLQQPKRSLPPRLPPTPQPTIIPYPYPTPRCLAPCLSNKSGEIICVCPQ